MSDPSPHNDKQNPSVRVFVWRMVLLLFIALIITVVVWGVLQLVV